MNDNRTSTYSAMEMTDGISDQSRAYLTGVTVSCGSRSTCICNIRRQKDARRSMGSRPSATHLHIMNMHNNIIHMQHNTARLKLTFNSNYPNPETNPSA